VLHRHIPALFEIEPVEEVLRHRPDQGLLLVEPVRLLLGPGLTQPGVGGVGLGQQRDAAEVGAAIEQRPADAVQDGLGRLVS